MLCDVVRRRRRRRRRWAHAPVIHAASHFDHKKRVAWVSISMHTCGSFFYNYGAPLGGPSGRRSSAITPHGSILTSLWRKFVRLYELFSSIYDTKTQNKQLKLRVRLKTVKLK